MDDNRTVDGHVGRLARGFRVQYTAGIQPMSLQTRCYNLIRRINNAVFGTNHPMLYEITEWTPGEEWLYMIVRASDGTTSVRDVKHVGRFHPLRRFYYQMSEP